MGESIRDPRRSPRLRLCAQAKVEIHRAVRRGVTRDMGAGGCLLVPDEPIVRGTVVNLVLRFDAVAEPLALQGRVAWAHKELAGVEFGPKSVVDAAGWWSAIEAQPQFQAMLKAVLPELPLPTMVFASRGVPGARLSPDEATVLRAAGAGATVGDLLARSGLQTARAARAIFGLLEKGTLSLQRGAGAPALAPPAVPLAPAIATLATHEVTAKLADTLLRGNSCTHRPGPAQALLDAARGEARKGQYSKAISFAREALKLSPRDREIATALAQFVCHRTAVPDPALT
jgi:PilZ domain/Tetratricopeptide repeat